MHIDAVRRIHTFIARQPLQKSINQRLNRCWGISLLTGFHLHPNNFTRLLLRIWAEIHDHRSRVISRNPITSQQFLPKRCMYIFSGCQHKPTFPIKLWRREQQHNKHVICWMMNNNKSIGCLSISSSPLHCNNSFLVISILWAFCSCSTYSFSDWPCFFLTCPT